MEDTQRDNMYRWHFDNSETEAIVYADSKQGAFIKIGEIFPQSCIDFRLIGVEEILSLEDKLA